MLDKSVADSAVTDPIFGKKNFHFPRVLVELALHSWAKHRDVVGHNVKGTPCLATTSNALKNSLSSPFLSTTAAIFLVSLDLLHELY